MSTTGLIPFKDDEGQFRWKLTARNGRVIACCGEGFKSKQALVKSVSAFLDLIDRADLHGQFDERIGSV